MRVSVIIPAYNSSSTIDKTVQSLISQTFTDWEAIIVDDGSTDPTSEIILQYSESDNRIKVLNSFHKGTSAARNLALHNSTGEWILLLDSDDWIAENYLEELTNKAAIDNSLDAVCCDWARVNPDGRIYNEHMPPGEGDLFHLFVQTNPLPIHSFIIRKSKVQDAGEFDETLVTCQDWDLLQRIARLGTKFGCVNKVLAYYRMSLNSSTRNFLQLMKDSSTIILRGCSQDERLKNVKTKYSAGLPGNEFYVYYSACWAAGLALGNNKGPDPVLQFAIHFAPDINPEPLAELIFEAAYISSCKDPDYWIDLYPAVEKYLKSFLETLEQKAGSFNLAKKIIIILENLIAEKIQIGHDLILGETLVKNINALEIPSDIAAGNKRVYAKVSWNNIEVGSFPVPLKNGFISSEAMQFEIADKFFWKILGEYFRTSLYPNLILEKNGDEIIVKRSDKILGKINPSPDPWDEIYEKFGWTLFLQEIWGKPDFTPDDFYNQGINISSGSVKTEKNKVFFDVSLPMYNIKTKADELEIEVLVAGKTTGSIKMLPDHGVIKSQKILSKINSDLGLEICKTAVRRGIIGNKQSLFKPLRQILQEKTISTVPSGLLIQTQNRKIAKMFAV